eukprot:CCRYP_005575-RA/>CCRYP_005575-RA protein AED:0.15 eAED:0.15 QI:0/0/0/1/0/0/2/0/214
MSICWLKLYDTEMVMAGRWGYGEQYCRKNVKEYVKRIRKLKPLKISFDNLHPRCKFLGVDCIHARSQEFRCDPDSKWLSMCCRWVSGPQPASVHDITILRGGKAGKMNEWNRDALYFNIPDGVKLVGDSGYDGQRDKVTTTMDAHAPDTKALFKRIKSQLESCNGRFKNFKVIRESFRHGQGTDDKLKRHKYSFEACVVLVQYDIENGHPLFEV